MKKKLLLSVFILLLVFTFTGCGSSNKGEKEPEKEEVVDETLFKINNIEFHLDKENDFYGIKYTVSKDFKEAQNGLYVPYMQYNYYQEDGSNLLYFRIFYYKNKDIKYAINDLGLDKTIELVDGKTDNMEYKLYKTPRDDGGTINHYFIIKDDNVFVVSYISKYDLKEFETKSLKLIKF